MRLINVNDLNNFNLIIENYSTENLIISFHSLFNNRDFLIFLKLKDQILRTPIKAYNLNYKSFISFITPFILVSDFAWTFTLIEMNNQRILGKVPQNWWNQTSYPNRRFVWGTSRRDGHVSVLCQKTGVYWSSRLSIFTQIVSWFVRKKGIHRWRDIRLDR